MLGRKILTAAVGAMAAALLMQPLLLAKPGVITTSDGSTFVGDIDDTAADKVVIKDGKGPGIEISKSNVKTTKFFKTPQEEYDARMAQVPANDVKGRIAVAHWAMDSQQPELAREATESALKIDPNNPGAKALLKQLDAMKPAVPDTEKPDAAMKGKTRLVTKEEVNRIRQLEWQANEDNVRVNVDKETKSTYLARSRDMTPAVFNKMTPTQQAREILSHGSPKLWGGVHVMSDPASMANYTKTIEKIVITGCAAAGCHDASSKTNFILHTEASDEAAYTNFLMLQSYRTTVDKVERLMIDRDQPGDSLLSEYMLAPKVANTPHPKAEGYNGVFKNVQDPRFKLVTGWLRALPTIPPDYGIDLTKPPPTPATEPAAPVEPEKPAPGVAPKSPEKMEKGAGAPPEK
jgi:hypothetical protein